VECRLWLICEVRLFERTDGGRGCIWDMKASYERLHLFS